MSNNKNKSLLLAVKKILADNGPMPREEIINKLKETDDATDLQNLNQLIRKHGDMFKVGASKGFVYLKNEKREPVRASVR